MKLYKSTDNQNLTFKLGDKRSGVYCRALIYNNNQQQIMVVPLFLINDGLYSSQVSPSLPVGSYHIVYQAFKDAAYTRPYRFYQDDEEFLRIEDIQETINTKVDQAIDQVDDLDAQVT